MYKNKNIFDHEVTQELIERVKALTPDTQGLWGKMNVAQMLAHCNITYELAFENKHPKPGFFKRLMLKLFVKSAVVNDKPYRRNTPTAPVFKVSSEQDFAAEQARLISFLQKTAELGPTHFDGRESHSFGPLTEHQWSNMFYKHLDHHLSQFGV